MIPKRSADVLTHSFAKQLQLDEYIVYVPPAKSRPSALTEVSPAFQFRSRNLYQRILTFLAG
jgi:hypothetical protein